METEESRCKNIQRDNFLGKKVDEGQQQRIRLVFLKVRHVVDLQHGPVQELLVTLSNGGVLSEFS